MSLKDELPTLEKGSPDFGGQVRALREVLAKLIDTVESNPELFAVAEKPAGEPEKNEASVEPEKAPEAAKPASKPATRAAAK